MTEPQNSPAERINPNAEEGQLERAERELPPLTRRVSVLVDLGVSHIRFDDDGGSCIRQRQIEVPSIPRPPSTSWAAISNAFACPSCAYLDWVSSFLWILSSSSCIRIARITPAKASPENGELTAPNMSPKGPGFSGLPSRDVIKAQESSQTIIVTATARVATTIHFKGVDSRSSFMPSPYFPPRLHLGRAEGGLGKQSV